jgi:hypothetical protein
LAALSHSMGETLGVLRTAWAAAMLVAGSAAFCLASIGY